MVLCIHFPNIFLLFPFPFQTSFFFTFLHHFTIPIPVFFYLSRFLCFHFLFLFSSLTPCFNNPLLMSFSIPNFPFSFPSRSLCFSTSHYPFLTLHYLFHLISSSLLPLLSLHFPSLIIPLIFLLPLSPWSSPRTLTEIIQNAFHTPPQAWPPYLYFLAHNTTE